jgi:hypothetical protein
VKELPFISMPVPLWTTRAASLDFFLTRPLFFFHNLVKNPIDLLFL